MQRESEGIAVTVNGEPIEENQIEAEADRMRSAYESTFPDQPEEERERQLRDWAAENVIDRLLLRQAALKHVAATPPERLKEAYQEVVRSNGGEGTFSIQLQAMGVTKEDVLKDLDAQLRTQEHIETLQRSISEPSEAEVQASFAGHETEFMLPELVRVGHIVVHVDNARKPEEAEEIIQKVEKELRDGAVFEALAAKYSDCPDNDGDLGWFPRGEMVEEFEDVVFALEKDQLSGIIHSPFGFHIAKLYDRRPARPMSFEEAKEQIVTRLKDERKDRVIEEVLDGLRAQSEIRYL